MKGHRLTPLAENDLEDIWFYTFERWSEDQADKYHDEIIAVIEQLTSGMLIGRHTEIRRGYFKYPSGKHPIFYHSVDGVIEVIRILHQSMDIDSPNTSPPPNRIRPRPFPIAVNQCYP